MSRDKKRSNRHWHLLETRMAQAKRSQVDGRANRAMIWALIAGALLLLGIHLLVNHTG